MDPFWIVIYVDGQNYRLKVERIYRSNQVERYRVTAGGKELVLQNNYPLFQSKGLKHRKGQWKLIEGNYTNKNALQSIIETIDAYLKQNRSGV